MFKNKQYLGDGVYCEFDGTNLILTTPEGARPQTIYLEPEVWFALKSYVESLQRGLTNS